MDARNKAIYVKPTAELLFLSKHMNLLGSLSTQAGFEDVDPQAPSFEDIEVNNDF